MPKEESMDSFERKMQTYAMESDRNFCQPFQPCGLHYAEPHTAAYTFGSGQPSCFFHKNYEWTNTKDRLPGWNFLMFKKAPIQGISLAFVERDKVPGRSPQKILDSYARLYQPNSVKTYLG